MIYIYVQLFVWFVHIRVPVVYGELSITIILTDVCDGIDFPKKPAFSVRMAPEPVTDLSVPPGQGVSRMAASRLQCFTPGGTQHGGQLCRTRLGGLHSASHNVQGSRAVKVIHQ